MVIEEKQYNRSIGQEEVVSKKGSKQKKDILSCLEYPWFNSKSAENDMMMKSCHIFYFLDIVISFHHYYLLPSTYPSIYLTYLT